MHTIHAQRVDERRAEDDAADTAGEATARDEPIASECCWSAWHSMTSKHGFPVSGIWRPQSLVADVRSCELEPASACVGAAGLAKGQMLCVTGSCDGHVRLFVAPCVARHAPCVLGLVGIGDSSSHTAAHSSVAKARFIPAELAPASALSRQPSGSKATMAQKPGRSTHVISVGGRDGCVVQWRLVRHGTAQQLPERDGSPEKGCEIVSVGSQSPPTGADGCYLADLVANTPWQQ